MLIKKCLLGALVSMTALGVAQAAGEYPERAVRVYVGFAPGGATDMLARYYADQLSRVLGQPFVVENRAGSGGNVAIQALSRVKPDGYTLAMGANYIAANAAFKRNKYDWETELQPVALVAATPNILMVPPNSPFNSVDDIIAAAKGSNTFLTYGSAGVGSSIHLAGELFQAMTGTKLTHVPYRGASPAELALMAGEVDMMFGSPSNAVALIKGGKLKALAITGLQPIKALPGVPTLDQSGLAGFNVGASYVLMAPAGVSAEVLKRLSSAVTEINASAETTAFNDRIYATSMSGGPVQAKEFLESEYQKWSKLVKENNLQIE
jgi:tripartite-type tricarboxylate transporter receptor subunit TctC